LSASSKRAARRNKRELKIGDRIVNFDGIENPTWERVRNDSLIAPEREIPIVVEREGQRVPLTIKPTKVEKDGNVIGMLDLEPDVGVEPVVVDRWQENPRRKPVCRKAIGHFDQRQPVRNSHGNRQSDSRSKKTQPINFLSSATASAKEIPIQAEQGDGRFSGSARQFGPDEKSMTREPVDIGRAASFAVNSNLEIIRLTGKVLSA
jgi:membrane-associated protease RseP (regulator of RpoE activity)